MVLKGGHYVYDYLTHLNSSNLSINEIAIAASLTSVSVAVAGFYLGLAAVAVADLAYAIRGNRFQENKGSMES